MPDQSSNSIRRNGSRAYFSRSTRTSQKNANFEDSQKYARLELCKIFEKKSEVCARYTKGIFHVARKYRVSRTSLGVDGNSEVRKVTYKTVFYLKSTSHHIFPKDRKRTRSSQKTAEKRRISGFLLFLRSFRSIFVKVPVPGARYLCTSTSI